jgi:hypothetical protein
MLTCFSALNHNIGYCYNDARDIKWVWTQIVTNRMQEEQGALRTEHWP